WGGGTESGGGRQVRVTPTSCRAREQSSHRDASVCVLPCVVCISCLPSDLEGAIWQSGKASADFVNSGGMRAIVCCSLFICCSYCLTLFQFNLTCHKSCAVFTWKLEWHGVTSCVYECIQDVKCSNFVLIMQPCHVLIIDNLYLVILTVGRATDPSVGIPQRGRSTG
ncbi:Os06g0146300, partial [Oryza sativa Japonica Group]